MAKVTDIQDKNGATREIQDKDWANRTSQSSIASSDYVLLEDTSGAYHKIAKASFTEAVRGALGSVINSVAKGTDIAKLPVLDSNNDLGMGTLANVASVLGENSIFYAAPTPNGSLNETLQGIYNIAYNVVGVPSGLQYGWAVCVKGSVNYYQVVFSTDPANKIHVRFRSAIEPYDWSDWVTYTGV